MHTYRGSSYKMNKYAEHKEEQYQIVKLKQTILK